MERFGVCCERKLSWPKKTEIGSTGTLSTNLQQTKGKGDEHPKLTTIILHSDEFRMLAHLMYWQDYEQIEQSSTLSLLHER